MTEPSLPTPPAVLDPSDLLAATGFGASLLSALEALPAPDQAPTADAMQALVAQMRQIALALQARDPTAFRRRAGLLGRLMGRDLEAQRQAEQLAGRLGVLLIRADRLAAQVRALSAETGRAADKDLAGAEAIEDWIAAGQALQERGAGAWREAFARRLDHLRRMASLQRLQAAQWRIVQVQMQELLERYQRIRDTLLPAWRQQALAQAAVRLPTQLQDMQRIQADIATEVAAMQARLD